MRVCACLRVLCKHSLSRDVQSKRQCAEKLHRRRGGVLEPTRQARSPEEIYAHHLTDEVDLEEAGHEEDHEEHPVPVGVRQAEELVRGGHPRLQDVPDIGVRIIVLSPVTTAGCALF